MGFGGLVPPSQQTLPPFVSPIPQILPLSKSLPGLLNVALPPAAAAAAPATPTKDNDL